MPENKMIGLLLAKAEVTYGTDPTPTASANTIAVVRDTVNWKVSTTRHPRVILDGGFSEVPGFNVLPNVEISFRTELRGNRTDGETADISSGASANAIEIDCLLQACDLAATYTAEVDAVNHSRDGNVTYKPTVPTDEGESVTFYFYTGLKLHKVLGAKGTFKIIWEAGKMAYIDWTFRGKYSAVTDASIPSPTWLATKPPTFVAASTLAYDSYAPVLAKVEFDLGNQIGMRPDAAASDGVKGFIITGRSSKGTLDPESVAEATHPFFADLISGDVKSLVLPIGGDVEGNSILATIGTQMTDISYADREQVRVKNVSFQSVRDALSSALGSDVALKFF